MIALDWTPIYCRHGPDKAPAKWMYNSLTSEWRYPDGREIGEPVAEPTLFDGLFTEQTPVAAAAD